MTAQEKAKELVDKFRNEFNWVEKDHDVDLYRDTRQCALIAVDEILSINYPFSSVDNFYCHANYWNEVKQEIEKL